MMYRWVVFLHILGALLFFMAHGASALMAFRLRKERNLERLRALLTMSEGALPIMWLGLLILLLAGIGAGFMGSWWSFGWIWVSLALMVVLIGWMGYYAQTRYGPIRKALGMDYRGQPGDNPPQGEAEVASLIQQANPVLLMGGGFGLAAIILWLMVMKPF